MKIPFAIKFILAIPLVFLLLLILMNGDGVNMGRVLVSVGIPIGIYFIVINSKKKKINFQ